MTLNSNFFEDHPKEKMEIESPSDEINSYGGDFGSIRSSENIRTTKNTINSETSGISGDLKEENSFFSNIDIGFQSNINRHEIRDDMEMKNEEDEVVMEYEVYLSHSLEKSLYLIQYPLKPKNRPFDFKALKEISIKPNHGIINMDFQLNHNASDFDSDSEFKKKTKLTLKSKPVPLKSNYCVGVMRGTSLFLTPLKNVVKMLPDTQYLNEHFEHEIRMVDDDPSDSEEGEKEKKSKKTSSDTQVVQQVQTRRELRELEKSYHFIHSLEEQENPISLKYHDKESNNSISIFEKLLTAPFGEIVFNMDRNQYINALVPYKEDPLAKFTKKVISLETIKHEKNPKIQVAYIMQAAKILPYNRIKELATQSTDDNQLLNILTSVSHFIQGRWIGNAHTSSEPGMYERWNFMLIQFWKYGSVDRGEFSRITKLSPEKSIELLQTISELDKDARLWKLKGNPDNEFEFKYPELFEAHTKLLQTLESETLHHIESGFTKISTYSKDKIGSSLTEEEIKKVTQFFLTKLGQQYGVVSPKLIRSKLAETQAKNELYKKITVDHIKKMLNNCYRHFNGCYVLKKCPLGEEAAPFRDALIEELNQRKSMTKEEIREAVEAAVGKPLETNMFFKFTQELCKQPSVGSKLYVAKDGTEAF